MATISKISEVEKIFNQENLKGRKLSRDELEDLLNRTIKREEWKDYDENGISIKEEKDDGRIQYETYSVEVKKQRDNVLKDTIYTLNKDDAIVNIVHDISNDIKAAVRTKGIIKFKIEAVIRATNPVSNLVVDNFGINERWDKISTNDLTEVDDVIFDQIITLKEQFHERSDGESGLVFQGISKIITKITEAPNNAAGSYIELPKSISDKKATINVKNNDNECFKWAVLAALYHNEGNNKYHKNVPSTYKKYYNELNFSRLKFPIAIKDIPKFEDLNNNMAINVYTVCKMVFSNIYISKHYNNEMKLPDDIKEVNLLYLVENYDDEDLIQGDKLKYSSNQHYVAITNFDKLFGKTVKNCYVKHFAICKKCLVAFYSQKEYSKHLMYCKTGTPSIEMPDEDNKFDSFKKLRATHRHDIVIYGDTEAMLIKKDDKTLKHVISSIGFCIKTSAGIELKSERNQLFRGRNCMKNFANSIKLVIDEYFKLTQKYPTYDVSTPEFTNAVNSYICHICNKHIDNERVIDHSHITGKILGAAHKICNEKRVNNRFIPIYFHNLSNYDAHFIINQMSLFGDGEIKLIPKTEERYISFTKHILPEGQKKSIGLVFMDSYRTMPASLDTLAENLLKSNGIEAFRNLISVIGLDTVKDLVMWEKQETKNVQRTIVDRNYQADYKTIEQKSVTKKLKGVFPYEYVDSWEKYNETNILSKDHFFDTLNNKHISDDAYNQYLKVFKTMKNLEEYSDFYLKTDVLLLADVFEAFRDTCLKQYGLDPVYYYTAPGLFWDAMLKMTGVTYELLTDYNMILYFEEGTRGGISTVLGDKYVDVDNKNYLTNSAIDCNAQNRRK